MDINNDDIYEEFQEKCCFCGSFDVESEDYYFTDDNLVDHLDTLVFCKTCGCIDKFYMSEHDLCTNKIRYDDYLFRKNKPIKYIIKNVINMFDIYYISMNNNAIISNINDKTTIKNVVINNLGTHFLKYEYNFLEKLLTMFIDDPFIFNKIIRSYNFPHNINCNIYNIISIMRLTNNDKFYRDLLGIYDYDEVSNLFRRKYISYSTPSIPKFHKGNVRQIEIPGEF